MKTSVLILKPKMTFPNFNKTAFMSSFWEVAFYFVFAVVSQDKKCCSEAERSTHVHPGVCCLSALKWTAGRGWVCTGTWRSLLKRRRWWEQTPTLLSFCVQFHFINEREISYGNKILGSELCIKKQNKTKKVKKTQQNTFRSA